MIDWNGLFTLIAPAALQTLVMVFASDFFSLALGFPLGILLCVSDPVSGIRPRPVLYQIVSRVINVLRSFPFIILMILLFPLSRLLIGTSIGTAASIVPLSIAAAPFAARIAENSFKEVDEGVVQAADDYKPYRIFGDGRSCRRRRVGRLGNTLRISAFSRRCYGVFSCPHYTFCGIDPNARQCFKQRPNKAKIIGWCV